MNENDLGRMHEISIDRIVLDGVSGGQFEEERFRERLSAELHRLLARPEVVEGLRESRAEDRVTRTVESGELSDPAQVARHIVRTIQSSP